MFDKILAPIMERKGQQTTKAGAVLAIVAGTMFPDVDVPMLMSSLRDFIDAGMNLWQQIDGIKGVSWAGVAGLALRYLFVNRQELFKDHPA